MKRETELLLMAWRARPDMSCEYASPGWLQFTGYGEEQALGEGWSRVVHAEDLARWLDTCVRAFDAREPFEIEYRMRRRDGEYRWVLDRAAPRYAQGLFLGYEGVCVDIDERKRAELSMARALERERRLRVAAEEASRAKDTFLISVLAELRAPTQAMATWSEHLREQLPPSSEVDEALEAIARNARDQTRVIQNLLELSGARPHSRPADKQGNCALLSGVRVLVVEHDPQVRELLLKVVRVAGAEARAADGTSQALQLLDEWRPDIMLSDIGPRGDDGYVLIRAVRSLPAERGGCLRAAAITSRASPGVVAAGYDAQLAKPVEPVALLATVARLVGT
jgi:PAS domain S-box-containing protein